MNSIQEFPVGRMEVSTTSKLNYVFYIIKSHWHYIFMKIIKRTWLKNSAKIHTNVVCSCFVIFIKLRKRTLYWVNKSWKPDCLIVWKTLLDKKFTLIKLYIYQKNIHYQLCALYYFLCKGSWNLRATGLYRVL